MIDGLLLLVLVIDGLLLFVLVVDGVTAICSCR